MSPAESRYSAPGKVFLLGEYAVLQGQPAIIAAVGPRFRLSVGQDQREGSFHPESPAGKLTDWARGRGLSPFGFSFFDPLKGAGGFGASTAQFALLYRAWADRHGLSLEAGEVWRLYRQLTSRPDGGGPSGADLIVQWAAGIVEFQASGLDSRIAPLGDSFRKDLFVFSATSIEGRKVTTHTHLEKLATTNFASLLEPLEKGLEAWRRGDSRSFGSAMIEYAERLSALGLEVEAARADREAFCRLPGVLGAKGAGAMLADGLIVALDPEQEARDAVLELAHERGLRLVAAGIPWLRGTVSETEEIRTEETL